MGVTDRAERRVPVAAVSYGRSPGCRRVLAKDESADQQFRYLKSAEKLPTQSSLLVVSRLDGEQWRVETDDC